MRRLLPIAAALVLTACGPGETGSDPVSPEPTTTTAAPAPAEPATTTADVCLPTAGPDGNRLARGRGALPDTEPVDVGLPGEPAWITGVPRPDGVLWVVALEDGRVVGVEHPDGSPPRPPEPLGELAPGRPPAVACAAGQEPELLTAGSPLTHPVPAGDDLAFVDDAGRIHVGDRSADEGTLPDARPVTDGDGRVVTIAGATDRYDHGVLGDELEGGAVVEAARDGARLGLRRVTAPAGLVIEGHAPIWADVDDDGRRDVVVVLSDDEDGGRPAALTGGRWRVGPGIGQGRRWRHAIAVGPFGPGGEVELVAGRTPHLAGGLEFLRLGDDGWRVTAALEGLTSHELGSRNLDQAVAGDFDGDGRPEAVAMDPGRETLVAVAHTGDGAREAWRAAAGGAVVTNLAPAALGNGRLGLAVGTKGRKMRAWGVE